MERVERAMVSHPATVLLAMQQQGMIKLDWSGPGDRAFPHDLTNYPDERLCFIATDDPEWDLDDPLILKGLLAFYPDTVWIATPGATADAFTKVSSDTEEYGAVVLIMTTEARAFRWLHAIADQKPTKVDRDYAGLSSHIQLLLPMAKGSVDTFLRDALEQIEGG